MSDDLNQNERDLLWSSIDQQRHDIGQLWDSYIFDLPRIQRDASQYVDALRFTIDELIKWKSLFLAKEKMLENTKRLIGVTEMYNEFDYRSDNIDRLIANCLSFRKPAPQTTENADEGIPAIRKLEGALISQRNLRFQVKWQAEQILRMKKG